MTNTPDKVPDRTALILECGRFLEARKAEYLRELRSVDEAAAGETKSSAGDKYETAREMMAQARALLSRNLAETESGLDTLARMAAAPLRPIIGFGSLVQTNQGWHLLGAGLGEKGNRRHSRPDDFAGQPPGRRLERQIGRRPLCLARRGSRHPARSRSLVPVPSFPLPIG